MAHHQGMAFLSLAYLLLDRPMQRRFDADPAFQATDAAAAGARAARADDLSRTRPRSRRRARGRRDAESNLRVFTTPNTPAPEVQLLSNGRYHVMVTNAGGGYSRWRDLAVTRWREDATRDNWGTFCYLRDVDERRRSGPSRTSRRSSRPSSYEAIFSQGRAEFRRRDDDIETHTEIGVSPEDDIELRRVSITNRGTHHADDRADELRRGGARAAGRRRRAPGVQQPVRADRAGPRAPGDPVHAPAALAATSGRRGCFHLMTVHGTGGGPTSYETDRAAFIGRGRSIADPAAMHRDALDRQRGLGARSRSSRSAARVVLEPDETARVHMVTGVAETRDGALGA